MASGLTNFLEYATSKGAIFLQNAYESDDSTFQFLESTQSSCRRTRKLKQFIDERPCQFRPQFFLVLARLYFWRLGYLKLNEAECEIANEWCNQLLEFTSTGMDVYEDGDNLRSSVLSTAIKTCFDSRFGRGLAVDSSLRYFARKNDGIMMGFMLDYKSGVSNSISLWIEIKNECGNDDWNSIKFQFGSICYSLISKLSHLKLHEVDGASEHFLNCAIFFSESIWDSYFGQNMNSGDQ